MELNPQWSLGLLNKIRNEGAEKGERERREGRGDEGVEKDREEGKSEKEGRWEIRGRTGSPSNSSGR